ncbi:mitochondrial import translocase, subunit Tom22 [Lophium mytilinum]|uniref:Mitochondrial import translocase, subunit Tom22 n=1 Tax=Lophium mytilinum TaxID=390894 RepID=A0A6A6REM6_9PEZI|nr:mitochondrial import translocase, subunit Tom22 [Lophium mytilinum]
MVKLEEVLDEEFTRTQDAPIDDENDWDTDSTDSDNDSEISLAPDESLYERISALQDIVPASTRRKISSTVSTTTSWVKSSLLFGGKSLWVISTTTLLLGVPWALAYSEEQQMVEMEREMKMQQSASEILAPGTSAQPAQARPAL